MSWHTSMLLCLLVGVMITAPGCRGCFTEDPIEARKRKLAEEKEKKKRKPDFDLDRDVRIQPGNKTIKLNLVKAGHWTTATRPVSYTHLTLPTN